MNKIEEVQVISEVYSDLKNAQRFYNRNEKGIGDYFYDSVIADMHTLKLYAGIHKKTAYDVYRMSARRFPYFIFYIIDVRIARVVAVLPMRRHPEWIENQLAKRRR
jgi:hypothetical protein